MKKILLFLICVLFISCQNVSAKAINLNNFNYGHWKIIEYTNYLKYPITSIKEANEIISSNQNIVITKDKFYFLTFEITKPTYRIVKIGFAPKGQKKSEYAGHKNIYDVGYKKDRKYKQAIQVGDKKDMYYEFEILDDNHLLIMLYDYFFILEKKKGD
ncbi:MAG: hypothetical protein V1749_02615 [Candidatus Desantisbacteria bacterium]